MDKRAGKWTQKELREEIFKTGEGMIRHFAQEFRGVSMAAGISLGGRTVWSNHCGGSGAELASERIAVHSITKLYTMLCFLLAEEEGRLRADWPITRYLPEMVLPHRGRDIASRVTPQHLLTHTSGLQREAAVGNNFFHHHSLQDHVKSICESELLFEPGAGYAYSNLGYDVLGYLLGIQGALKYEEQMTAKVLSRLGMANARFGNENSSQSPSGGLLCTFSDLMNSLNLITDAQKADDFLPRRMWKRIQTIATIREGQRSGYGYAVKVFKEREATICSITGTHMGFYGVLAWTDRYRMGYVAICRGFTPMAMRAMDRHDAFYNLIEGLESGNTGPGEPAGAAAEPGDEPPAAEFEGSYLGADNRLLYLRSCEGTLCLSRDNRDWTPLRSSGKGCYRVGEEDEIQLDIEAGKAQGFYWNGQFEFGYYHFNDGLRNDLGGGCGTVQSYVLDAHRRLSGREQALARLTRVRHATLTYAEDGIYLNKNYRLTHEKGHLYRKAMGEPVKIHGERLVVGNLKYSKLQQVTTEDGGSTDGSNHG